MVPFLCAPNPVRRPSDFNKKCIGTKNYGYYDS